MTEFGLFLDEYCRKYLNITLIDLLHENGIQLKDISSFVVQKLVIAMEEIINKPQPRCGDCKHADNSWADDGEIFCPLADRCEPENFYCADFEEKGKE